ncbi:prophage protein [Escherichia coli O111:H8 str. CFSAN001632]|nr:prophage protein [Escherichia coli O111:H8 str. CFSAN001632]
MTVCSRCLSAILTALPFTPSNQKPSRLFHAQREKYGHSVVSLRHRSGNAVYPPETRAVPPSPARRKNAFFVHVRILDGSSRHAGRKYKKSFKKIVQTCALSCKQKKAPYRRFKNINCCCVLIANHEHMLHKHLCALQFQPG